jgi:tRNA A-37 threonylcarbamoyl transferase component Bud32
MDIEDVVEFKREAIRLGLVTEAQMLEALDASGLANPDLQQLIRHLQRMGFLTPWQTGKLLKGETDGYFLGGYRMLYKVASGSFGRVYRADDQSSGRVVAIKVLRRRWSEDKQKIDLFAREGKVGLTLKHPGIVEIHAFNQDPKSGQYYIVMEFVEGGNLREILAIRKKLKADEAMRIIEDSAAGLAYAYSRGVTHRDIKLTNLLISSQGQAKLVDFGLAQFFSTVAKSDKERVDRTVDYAGLERATSVKFGDVRSDIFFLGCVAFEALTGRSPLEMTRDKHKRMHAQRFLDIQALKPDEIKAPQSVYRLVETMLQLAPEHRYQTPAQLLEGVKTARRELEGGGGRAAAARTLFIVEPDEGLQGKLREGFKKLGYRVLMSIDPMRALDRFRQQPFDALVVNAATIGEEGRLVFQQILSESASKQVPCAGVILFSEQQKEDALRVKENATTKTLMHPVKFGQLKQTLDRMLATKPA